MFFILTYILDAGKMTSWQESQPDNKHKASRISGWIFVIKIKVRAWKRGCGAGRKGTSSVKFGRDFSNVLEWNNRLA